MEGWLAALGAWRAGGSGHGRSREERPSSRRSRAEREKKHGLALVTQVEEREGKGVRSCAKYKKKTQNKLQKSEKAF